MRKLPVVTLILLVAAALSGCVQGEQSGTSTSGTSPATSVSTMGPSMPPLPQRPPAQWTPGPWIEGPCPVPSNMEPQSKPSPDLLALEAGGALTRYGWGQGGLEIKGRAVPGIRFAAAVGPLVFTAQQMGPTWQLVMRAPNLASIQQINTTAVTAMETDGSRIYVATQGNLSVYSDSLQVLGTVPLGARDASSTIVSIRVAQGFAYLLGGGAAPYFTYRVDVREPAAMQVVLLHDTKSSPSPKLQWLDTGNQTWYVEKNLQGEGTMMRSVTPLGLGNGTPGQDILLHSSSFPVQVQDPRPQQDSGYLVHDATFILPAWAIVEANNTLVHIQMRGPFLERSCSVPALGDVHVLERDGMLVTWGRNHVRLWDPAQPGMVRGDAGLPVPPVAMWLAAPV